MLAPSPTEPLHPGRAGLYSERMTRDLAASELARYLADRDFPCHACGYNLRACTEPFCPECGTVIPRPSILARQQAVRCRACGYELGDAPLERCPECGSDAITIGDDETPAGAATTAHLPWRSDRAWRGVPLVLAAPGLLSLILALGMLVQSVHPFSARRVALSVCAAAPAMLAAVWYTLRRECNGWPLRTRRRLALMACAAGCAVSAMAAYAWA